MTLSRYVDLTLLPQHADLIYACYLCHLVRFELAKKGTGSWIVQLSFSARHLMCVCLSVIG